MAICIRSTTAYEIVSEVHRKTDQTLQSSRQTLAREELSYKKITDYFKRNDGNFHQVNYNMWNSFRSNKGQIKLCKAYYKHWLERNFHKKKTNPELFQKKQWPFASGQLQHVE